MAETENLSPPTLNIIIQDYNTGSCLVNCDGSDAGSMLSVESVHDITPRYLKGDQQAGRRQKKNGEVFTPNVLVNLMTRIIAYIFFGFSDMFTQTGRDLIFKLTKRLRMSTKGAKAFICKHTLDCCCGEGALMVSRNNHQRRKKQGKKRSKRPTEELSPVPIENRCGVLDLKLRVVNQFANTHKEWIDMTRACIQTTYGYDLQADSVFLTRLAILLSVNDYHLARWGYPFIDGSKHEEEFAWIIAHNIFQMDAKTECVPYDPSTPCNLHIWSTGEVIPMNKLKSYIDNKSKK